MRIRAFRPEDIQAFRLCSSRAIGAFVTPDYDERLLSVLDREGSFVAVEDDTIVGTLGAYRFEVNAFGQAMPCAGTTIVGVLPTHRRRGALRGLMSAHLEWAQSQGLVAAVLWASETTIYRRFGYGPVTQQGRWTIDVQGFDDGAITDHDLRFVELEAATQGDLEPVQARLAAIYARHGLERAGALNRTPQWWRARHWHDDPNRRNGASQYQYVIAQRQGQDVGYVQFRRQSVWDEARPQDIVHVQELIGDPAARRCLWRFLASTDLVSTLEVFNRPPDDELIWIFEAGRRARLLEEDALWLCPLDVPRFLESRNLAVDASLVVHLSDRGESYELTTDRGQTQAQRTESQPELRLESTDLPGLLWGEFSLRALWEAGRAEMDEDRIATLSHLLHVQRRPWCPERF